MDPVPCIIISERKMIMFGFKKKATNSTTMIHYEGLPNFKQDFPCTVTLEEDCVVFGEKDGGTVKLPYIQILKLDAMPEVNFMAKYHNDKAKTKRGTVWFRVITYRSSAGEEKYIALWNVDSKTAKFFDQLEARIKKEAAEITL